MLVMIHHEQGFSRVEAPAASHPPFTGDLRNLEGQVSDNCCVGEDYESCVGEDYESCVGEDYEKNRGLSAPCPTVSRPTRYHFVP